VGGDGRVDVPGETHTWLQACNAPRWQMMPEGSPAEGFFNAELADTADNHDFGTSWMASTIRDAAAADRDSYLAAHPGAALLTINDVSLPRGGRTRDHKGHQTGLGCDLKLPRIDGGAGGITFRNTSEYDQRAAREMILAVLAQPLVSRVFFNDPDLIRERLCTEEKGHDDHIHFQIRPPEWGGFELVGVP
jgi:murein endopeptidase